MNGKTKTRVCIAIAVLGICIAVAGIRIKATAPQSSGTMITWIGVGIVFIASFLLSSSKPSKK